MPLFTGQALGGQWRKWLISAVKDTFTRANTTTSLGVSTFGNAWTAVKGTWFINNNRATTSDSPSNYSIASLEVSKTNQTITATDVGNGPGIAFWVVDSNNWWGAFQSLVTTYTAEVYYAGQPASYTPPSYYAGIPSSYYDGSYYRPPSYNSTYGAYDPGSYYAGDGYTSYYPGVPASYFPGSYFGGVASYYYPASTSYAYTLNLIKSLAGTVSSVSSAYLSSTASVALKVITSGVGITVSAYTDNGLTSQNGSSISFTATGATTGTKSGIIIAPTTNGQTTTISSFTAS